MHLLQAAGRSSVQQQWTSAFPGGQGVTSAAACNEARWGFGTGQEVPWAFGTGGCGIN